MDISSFQSPTLAPIVTSFRTFEYTTSSRHIKADVLAGPYDESGNVVLREYVFAFLDVDCVHIEVNAAPWLSLLKMQTEYQGQVVLVFEEGRIEIQAKRFSAKHTGTIPYGGKGKFTPICT